MFGYEDTLHERIKQLKEKMNILDNVIYIDVDETLLLPDNEDTFVPCKPNYPLIGMIKEWKKAGRSIVVWTSNGDGVEHARKIVRELDIERYVDLCLPKPMTIVDDDHLEYYRVIDPITFESRYRDYKDYE